MVELFAEFVQVCASDSKIIITLRHGFSDSLEWSVSRENSYHLSMHDVSFVGVGAPPTRGYVSVHHPTFHLYVYIHFS
jgi:hypothetical protein